MSRTRLTLCLTLTAFCVAPLARAADPVPPMPASGYSKAFPAAPASAVTYSASGVYQNLFAADLESGGSVASDRLGVTAGLNWRPAPPFGLGLQLNYEWQDWSFEPGAAFGATPPWDALERGSVSVPVMLALSEHVVTGVSPFAEWSFEREAGASDALTYGATLSAFGIFSRRFLLGGGAKIHRQFFATRVTAFVIVNWQLTEKLRITNSQAAGPLGAGGVELRWAPAPKWELSFGGVQRSDRFRMEGEGAPHGDVAEQSAIPFYGRVSYGVGTWLRADLYGGVLAAGRLKRWSPDGDQLVDEDIATDPAMALAFTTKW